MVFCTIQQSRSINLLNFTIVLFLCLGCFLCLFISRLSSFVTFTRNSCPPIVLCSCGQNQIQCIPFCFDPSGIKEGGVDDAQPNFTQAFCAQGTMVLLRESNPQFAPSLTLFFLFLFAFSPFASESLFFVG